MTERSLVVIDDIPAIETVSSAVDLVMSYLPTIAPKSIDPKRFAALLKIEFAKLENLSKCDPLDVLKSVSEVVQLGLEPGSEVNFGIFYSKKQGKYIFQKLTRYDGWYRILIESPRIQKIICDVVRERDEFYQDRLNEEYRHIIPQKEDRGEVTHAYCFVTLTNGQRIPRVLDKHDLDRHQRAAREGGEVGPWHDHYSVMAMKAAIQSWAGRNKGLINVIAREALAQDEESMLEEYQSTPPSQRRFEQAVSDLYGDEPLMKEIQDPIVHADRPPMRAPKVWDTESGTLVDTASGEVIEPEPDTEIDASPEPREASDVAVMTLKQWLQPRMNEMPARQRAAMIKSCGGGETALSDLADMAVLTKLEQLVAAREKGKTQTANSEEGALL